MKNDLYVTRQLFLALIQQIKKNRDPRWDEEFSFTLEEPPTNDKLHVEVISTSSRMGLLHPKVRMELLLKYIVPIADKIVG